MYKSITEIMEDDRKLVLSIYQSDGDVFWGILGVPEDYEVVSTNYLDDIKQVIDELESCAKDYLEMHKREFNT